MKDQMYSIYDKKAQYFGPPFVAVNDETACRMAEMMCDQNTLLAKHPEDFSIYSVSEWDNKSGEMTTQVPRFVDDVKAMQLNAELQKKAS